MVRLGHNRAWILLGSALLFWFQSLWPEALGSPLRPNLATQTSSRSSFAIDSLPPTPMVRPAPLVRITTPPEGSVFRTPTDFPIQVEAAGGPSHDTVLVWYTELYDGTNLIRSATEICDGACDRTYHSFQMRNLLPGYYTFTTQTQYRYPESAFGIAQVQIVVTDEAAPQPDPNSIVYRDGAFGVTFRGEPGQRFLIQASTNLISWPALLTNEFSSSTFDFIDPQATNFSRRFYRAVSLP